MHRSTRSNAKHLIRGRVIEESSEPFSPGDPLDEDEEYPTARQKQRQSGAVNSTGSIAGDSTAKPAVRRKVHYATKSIRATRKELCVDDTDSETASESSDDQRSFGSDTEEVGSDVSSHSSGFMDSEDAIVENVEEQSYTGKKECLHCKQAISTAKGRFCSRQCANRCNAARAHENKNTVPKSRKREQSLQSSSTEPSHSELQQKTKRKAAFPSFFDDDDLESLSICSENIKSSISKAVRKEKKLVSHQTSASISRQSPEIELPSPTSSRLPKIAPEAEEASSKPEKRKAAKYVSQVAREYLSNRPEFVQKLITEKPVASWDVMETAAFVQSTLVIESLTTDFVKNELDGQCLLLFESKTWEKFGIKYGPAVKVCNEAKQLLNIQKNFVLKTWYEELPKLVAEAVVQMEAASVKA